MSALARAVKFFLPPGRQLRRVQTGLLRGLRFNLDLHSESLFWLGLYERETYPHIERLASTCSAYVDIGAGKGELICYWLRRFPERPAIAVEPSAVELELLRENVRANTGTLPPALTFWPGFAGSGPAATHRTLADLCADLPDPVFVKIDIEGAEVALLAGAAAMLEARPCRFLIEVHSREGESTCLEQLQGCGYRTAVIDFATWRPWLRERRDLAHNRWLTAEPAAGREGQ